MKKFLKVLCAFLVVVVVSAAALAYWQRENIKAVKDFTTHTQEELEEKLQQNDQLIKETVNALPEVTIRDITDEEKEALRDGSLTHEELVDRLTKPEESKPASEDPAPPNSTPEQTPAVQEPETKPATKPETKPDDVKPEPTEYEKKLSATVAKVYVLREEYLIKLDNLQAEAIAAYKALPAEDRKGSKLVDFVSHFMSKATALEKSCDKKMDGIVIELETLIKENNGNLSLVDTIIDTYAKEKSLKKAWYMSELSKRGFL